MSTVTSPTIDLDGSTEIEVFHDFVTRLLLRGDRDVGVDQCVTEFREYAAERARFLDELEVSRAQARDGLARPLDPDALIQRVRENLAAKGITDA